MPKIIVRKVTMDDHCDICEYRSKGIDELYNRYTGRWMQEHVNEEGNILNEDICDMINSIDEFNILEDDYFFIGYPITHFYEAMVEGCNSIVVMRPDEYGFETIYDSNGNELQYSKCKTV